MTRPQVSTSVVVLLALCAGLAGGLAAAEAWGRYDALLRAHAARDSAEAESRRRFQQTRWRERRGMEQARQPLLGRRVPFDALEVRREQANQHCATVWVIEEVGADAHLMNVRLEGPGNAGREPHRGGPVIISQGWAYAAKGFRAGDTVVVVVPYMTCGGARLTSWGFARRWERPPLFGP